MVDPHDSTISRFVLVVLAVWLIDDMIRSLCSADSSKTMTSQHLTTALALALPLVMFSPVCGLLKMMHRTHTYVAVRGHSLTLSYVAKEVCAKAHQLRS